MAYRQTVLNERWNGGGLGQRNRPQERARGAVRAGANYTRDISR